LPIAVKLVEQVAWFDALSAAAPTRRWRSAVGERHGPVVRESGRVPEATDSVR